MSCHLCENEAIARCYTCGRLFCANHGTTDCATCQDSIREGDPSAQRISATRQRTANEAPWWRPRPAEEFAPPACYACQGLARAVCVGCGRHYCAEHAGRNSSCRECGTAADVSLYVIGGFLLLFASLALIALLLT